MGIAIVGSTSKFSGEGIGGMAAIKVGAREKAFAKRLSTALDNHPRCPDAHGRNTWLMRELAHQNINVSLESIRKWLAGEAIPRRAKMTALAKTLRVDETWLTMGVQPAAAEGETRLSKMEAALRSIARLTDDEAIQAIIDRALES